MGITQKDVRIYGFNTDDRDYASASQIVYSIYRSRDRDKFGSKVTKGYWGKIEDFIRKASRGSATIIRLIERLKKEFEAPTVHPVFMRTDISSYKIAIIDENGAVITPKDNEVTTYLTGIIRNLEDRKILDILLNEASYVVMLVRERIEIERNLEKLGVDFKNSEEEEIL